MTAFPEYMDEGSILREYEDGQARIIAEFCALDAEALNGGAGALPAGFRALTAEEGDALTTTMRVLVYDRGLGAIVPYHVRGYNSARGWRVAIVDGGEDVDTLWLDDDNPDFWSDADETSGRDRRGPQTADGAYVAVTLIDPDNLVPLLRESIRPELLDLDASGKRLVQCVTFPAAQPREALAWYRHRVTATMRLWVRFAFSDLATFPNEEPIAIETATLLAQQELGRALTYIEARQLAAAVRDILTSHWLEAAAQRENRIRQDEWLAEHQESSTNEQ